MESPRKLIKGKLSAAYNDNKNLVVDVFQKADAWILWFIGFSIGGLALFAGNLDKFANKLTTEQIHKIFIELFFSVISGVLFRYVYIWFYMLLIKNIYSRVSNDFDAQYDLPVFKPLIGNETFAELIILINTYTGSDFNNLIQQFADADENHRIALCSVLIDYYNKADAFYTEETTKGLDHLKERLEIYFGKKIEEINKKDNSGNKLFGRQFYLIITLGSILLLIFSVSFGLALYTFCFNIHL
jgi:hypothetical protein